MNIVSGFDPFMKNCCGFRITWPKLIIGGIIFFVLPLKSLNAQEPLQHKKCIFRADDGRLFINKELPLYLKVSTSADEGAESWLLESAQTAKYANPMYLDTEGWNTLRSPSAVDTATKKAVYPLQDIIFEMYADGIAPTSRLLFGHAKPFSLEGISFFGKETGFHFEAEDGMSGLKDVYYSLNGAGFVAASRSPLQISEEGTYSVQFYAVDNVGNVEDFHVYDFVVDHTAPVTSHEINGINKNRVLAPDATISLSSADSLSGVYRIWYAVDDSDFEVYRKPIPVARLKDGGGKITYYSEDHVGNSEDHKFIGTLASSRSNKDDQGEVFDYYIDREPPVAEFNFEGDYYESDREYISGSTRIVLSAKDDKSGVQKILYSYNSFMTSETYEVPFAPEGNSPVEISYAAVDWVENTALEKERHFYIDRLAPETKISFDGPVFRNRDTLFVAAQTKMILKATDKESGVKTVKYQLNGHENHYGEPFVVDQSGKHLLQYSSADNVNNQEEGKTLEFVVDKEGPSIHHHFSVEPIGEKVVRNEQYVIYPSNTKIYIGATDDVAGEESLKYSVNGAKMSETIPVVGLQPGNYEIDIEATDALKNSTSKTIRFSIEK